MVLGTRMCCDDDADEADLKGMIGLKKKIMTDDWATQSVNRYLSMICLRQICSQDLIASF
jgi:hypothetical protein